MTETTSAEILLVEDNSQDLELTQRALRKARLAHHIHVARDGAEALDFIFGEGPLHTDVRLENAPRIILLGLKLPKVDGLEVLKHIKRDPRTQSIPVIILTSSKEPNDVIESYRLGANSYIVKPVDFESFADAVRQIGIYWLFLNQPPTIPH